MAKLSDTKIRGAKPRDRPYKLFDSGGLASSYGGRNFTASLGASYRHDYRQRTTQSDVVGLDSAINEVLQSRDRLSEHSLRNIPSVNFSTQFTPNDRQTIAGSASWTRRGGLRTYTQLDDTTDPSGQVTSSTRRLSYGHDPATDYNATLRFTQKLSRPDESLDMSLHRSVSHQREHYDYTNDSFIPPESTFFNNLGFTEDQGATEADLDYSLPLAKAQTLKIGYAFEQDDYGLNNSGENIDPGTGLGTPNPGLIYDFTYRQRIHGFYQSYQGTFNAWAVLAGLRTEWTTTDGELRTTGPSTQTR
jgi:hypothetical protein